MHIFELPSYQSKEKMKYSLMSSLLNPPSYNANVSIKALFMSRVKACAPLCAFENEVCASHMGHVRVQREFTVA